MPGADRNFYRIDDLLLRFGAGALVLVLMAGGIGYLYAETIAQDPSYPPDYARFLIAKYAFAYFGLLMCPMIMLRFGWKIRQRERRIGAIWKLLRRNAQIRVPDLIANSHFTIDDIDRAVKMLNTRGLGHYVWDRDAGTVQDGRLRTMQLHVEKCEACGGSISLEVPIGFTKVPSCPYCNDPVSVDTLEERRHEALDQLRAEHAPEKPPWHAFAIPISIPIFALLLLVFWPAALVYAGYMVHRADSGLASESRTTS